MSRFIQGDCVRVMATFPGNAVDFILTDPPYLVGFRDRQGRTIAGDKTDEWLQPACNEMYRVLKKDALMVSFYGWNRVDRFMAAWKNAGFSVVGHLVFTKTYTSKAAYVGYRHECAYILAKGRPALPQKPLPDVLGWKYSGNRHHPTEKPVTSLQPLIESFTHPNAIVLDPFAGSGSTCVAALQSGRRYIGIELLEQYHRAGQQRLAAVQRAMQQGAANDIRPRSRQWWQLFRMVSQWHVDVVIVERRSFSIVAAVELDDASHLRPERRRRDILLEEVLRQAGIPLLRSHDARKLLQMTGEWLNTTGADQQSPEHRS